jgi:sialate O-acetylesterase
MEIAVTTTAGHQSPGPGDWGQGDFPFFFVQLANFMKRQEQPSDSGWAYLRESQLRTLRLKNTGMAVIIDIGDEKDIHPKDKLNVGKRLALSAEKVAYGMDVVASGPVFSKMEVKDGKAVLSFKSLGGGLVSKTGETLKSFAIAGADKKFVWAEARIEGDKVVVSSPAVKEPAAVRYAWADNPEASLFNKEGLPATPFRTDRWAAPQWIKPLERGQRNVAAK